MLTDTETIVGVPVWLEIAEQEGTQTGIVVTEVVTPAEFLRPVTLTLTFDSKRLNEVDTSNLQIVRWDEGMQVGVPISTTIQVLDENTWQAVVQTQKTGSFALSAPRIYQIYLPLVLAGKQ